MENRTSSTVTSSNILSLFDVLVKDGSGSLSVYPFHEELVELICSYVIVAWCPHTLKIYEGRSDVFRMPNILSM